MMPIETSTQEQMRGADVGPGDVSLVHIDDGLDAGNEGGADAVVEGLSVRSKDGDRTRLMALETYKFSRGNIAVKAGFCRTVRLRLHTGTMGRRRITNSRTFVIAVSRSEALLSMHLLCR